MSENIILRDYKGRFAKGNKGFSGNNNPMKQSSAKAKVAKANMGKYVSVETRKKLSQSSSRIMKTSANPMKRPEVRAKFTGSNGPNWGKHSQNYIDGKSRQRSHKKSNSKRQRELGFNSLNEPFEGSVAHHWNKDDIFYIPEGLHKSIPHSQRNLESMRQINEKVWEWFINEEMIGFAY